MNWIGLRESIVKLERLHPIAYSSPVAQSIVAGVAAVSHYEVGVSHLHVTESTLPVIYLKAQ